MSVTQKRPRQRVIKVDPVASYKELPPAVQQAKSRSMLKKAPRVPTSAPRVMDDIEGSRPELFSYNAPTLMGPERLSLGMGDPSSMDIWYLKRKQAESVQLGKLETEETILTLTADDMDDFGYVVLPTDTTATHFRAVEFTCQNLIYPVDEDNNDLILYEWPEGTTDPTQSGFQSIELSIPAGTYTPTNLAAAIQSSANLFTSRGYTYTVEFNPIRNLTQITAQKNGQNQFIAIGWTPLAKDVLGFTLSQNAQPQKILVSENPFDLSGPSCLVLRSDLVNGVKNKTMHGKQMANVLMSVPINVPFGYTLHHRNTNAHLAFGQSRSISRFNLEFLDGATMKKMNLRGAKWVLTLSFY